MSIQIMLWIIPIAILHILITWIMAFERGARARKFHSKEPNILPSSWPFVSVIVPAWQEHGTLEYCLQALQGLDYPSWEAIIVAGGSDGSYEAATDLVGNDNQFHVIEQPPHGKNAALNQGIKIARGDVLVMLDADSRMSTEWLKALVAPLTPSHPITCGDFWPLRETPISLGMQIEQIEARGISGYTGLQGGGGIAIRREVIETLGKLPEDVLVGVDWDLNVRIAILGIGCVFTPQAVLKTEIPATWREFWRNEVRWRKAHLASLFRHSGYFLSNLVASAKSLYIYLLAWFNVLASVAVGFILLFGTPEMKSIGLVLWFTWIAWLFLRRAAITATVAAYTHKWIWLKLAWVTAVQLGITLIAIIPTTLTFKKNKAHFKGPRRTLYT